MPIEYYSYTYTGIKKKWRYPDKPIPERLKHKYALNPKPEKRVHYG
jgi:hypothetical protein